MLTYKVNNYIKLVLKQGGFDEYLTQLIYEFMKYQEEYESITNYLNLLKENEIKLQFKHKYKYGLIRYSSKLNYYILYNNNNLILKILDIVNFNTTHTIHNYYFLILFTIIFYLLTIILCYFILLYFVLFFTLTFSI